MCKPSWSRLVSFCGLALIVGMATGCSTLNPLANTKVPTEPTANRTDVYRVEMHFDRGKTKTYDGYLNDAPAGNPVTVQTALELSGAIDQYKKMDIKVYRRVAESGRGIKMPVTFESKRDSVKVEQDYALHPGDRVVIRPLNEGLMSSLFGSTTNTRF